MRTKKIFMVLSIALTTFCLFGCGDDEENTPENGSTEQKGNYTATTSVKEVKLNRLESSAFKSEGGNNGRCWVVGAKDIYTDYNYKYELFLYQGYLCLASYIRHDGAYTCNGIYVRYEKLAGLAVYGAVEGISEMDSKSVSRGDGAANNGHWHFRQNIQPKYGYVACFLTESEVKYLRIYVKSYTLDGDGALNSVTVQYQLY